MPEIAESTLAGRPRTRAEIGLAGCLLTLGAVALVLIETAPRDQVAAALTHALGISLPIGLGLFRLSRSGTDRFAWLLVFIGLLWSLVTLAESSNEVLYSVGRSAVWGGEPALVYLILPFPFGRLETAIERRLVVIVVLTAVFLYLSTIFLAQFPEPSPWSTCGTACPGNAFDFATGTPGWIDDFIRPARETLTVLLWFAVAAARATRTARGATLMRGVHASDAAVILFRALTLLAYSILRASDGKTSAVTAL